MPRILAASLVALALFKIADYGARSLIRPVTLSFETPEFRYSATANSQGFRDREFGPKEGCRVLVLGDSFTYGWGVDAAQAWPQLLENSLRCEVVNLGLPGASPREYADTASALTTVLKPDLVLIAVLQGDDLAQLSPASLLPIRRERQWSRLPFYLAERAFPNIYEILRRHALAHFRLDEQWKKQADGVIGGLSPAQLRRYRSTDPEIRRLFESGNLNPPLIQLALLRPGYYRVTLEEHLPEVAILARDLLRVRHAAEQVGAGALVLAVPNGLYVDPSQLESRRRIGFEVAPEMLTSSRPDDAIAMAAHQAGLPFYSVTGEFRAASKSRKLFFTLDGHFTSEGHRTFAMLIAQELKQRLRSQPGPS